MTQTLRIILQRSAKVTLLALLLLGTVLAPTAAFAGKEGVFLSSNVYFTLEKVRFTSAAEEAVLRFAVRLHNGEGVPIDYNRFGVRVQDADGFYYSAQLTGKHKARVFAGETRDFHYISYLSPSAGAGDLKVTLFQWKTVNGTLQMSDIGSLSVQAAQEADAELPPEAVIPLYLIDPALPADVQIAFRIAQEYAVFENGAWDLYADLVAENTGASGAALPNGLSLRVEDANGRTVSVSTIDGGDKTLLPGKPQRLTVKASVPEFGADHSWTLQFFYLDGDNPVLIDGLPIGRELAISGIGEERVLTDSQGAETAKIRAAAATVSESKEGQFVQTAVEVTNTGSGVIAMPAITAAYQSGQGGVSVQAADGAKHRAYLSPGETETFLFNAFLPNGMDRENLQLAVFETRSASRNTAAGGTNAGAANASGTNGSGGNTQGQGTSGTGGANTAGVKVPVLLAGLADARTFGVDGSDYEYGQAIGLAANSNLEIALTEMELYQNENYGIPAAVAKVKITNLGGDALAFPDLTFQLIDGNGLVYSGTRQANVAEHIASNSSYMATWSFLLPNADTEKPMVLRVYNGQDSASGIPVAAIKVAFEEENTLDDDWSVYPYSIRSVRDDLFHSTLSTTFSYTLYLDAETVRTEQVLAEAGVQKIQFELTGGSGLTLSTQSLPFIGGTRLLNGMNIITFTNLKLDQYSSQNYINVFEVIETPNGLVKRKIGEIR